MMLVGWGVLRTTFLIPDLPSRLQEVKVTYIPYQGKIKFSVIISWKVETFINYVCFTKFVVFLYQLYIGDYSLMTLYLSDFQEIELIKNVFIV